MKHVTAARGSARLLPVRTVEVVSGRGRSITLSNVRCPVHGRPAAVEECVHCRDGEGLARDALARGHWIRCGRPADAPQGEPRVVDAMPAASLALRPSVARSVAAEALRSIGQSTAPVVDGAGRPIGVVSEAALLRARPGAKVSHAMVRVAVSVAESASIARAASLMAEHGLERVAVVSDDGAIVGVLGAVDVLAWLAERPPAGRGR